MKKLTLFQKKQLMKKMIKSRNRLIKKQFKRLKLTFNILETNVDENEKEFIKKMSFVAFSNAIESNLKKSLKETINFTLDFLKMERGVPEEVIPVVRNKTLEMLGSKVIGDKVVSITETTRKIINKTITDGQAQGLNVKDIANLLREKIKGMSEQRALIIAKTETCQTATTTYHQGLVEADLEKTWWHVGGGKTDRASHLACDNETVKSSEPFSNGLMHPHELGAPASEVVNCNCILI